MEANLWFTHIFKIKDKFNNKSFINKFLKINKMLMITIKNNKLINPETFKRPMRNKSKNEQTYTL